MFNKDVIEEESKEDFNSYDNRDNPQLLSEEDVNLKQPYQEQNEDLYINEVMEFNENCNSGFFMLESNGY